jgi:hypothetical protein
MFGEEGLYERERSPLSLAHSPANGKRMMIPYSIPSGSSGQGLMKEGDILD